MTSPTTNTVTELLVRQLREASNSTLSGFDKVHARALMREAAAALSTHPNTGTEDRATAREDVVERVARAICTADERNGGAAWDYGMSGDEKWNQRRHEQYRESARAAIEAYQASEAQRPPNPHTGGREAVIEECAQWHDREARNNAQDDDYAAMHIVSAAALRALSPPLQKTQKE